MTERATLIKPSTIRFERLLPGPVERVWAYLTESKKRATWLAAGEFDLRVGGKIELHFDNESLSDEAAPPGAMGAGKHSAEGKITRLVLKAVIFDGGHQTGAARRSGRASATRSSTASWSSRGWSIMNSLTPTSR